MLPVDLFLYLSVIFLIFKLFHCCRVERKEKARLKSVKFQGKGSVNDGKVNSFNCYLLKGSCSFSGHFSSL